MTPGLCSISLLDMHWWISLGGIPGAILKCISLCEVDKEVYMDRPSTPRFWLRERVYFICTLQADPYTTMQHDYYVIADRV